MESASGLRVEQVESWLEITLDRPERRNALDQGLVEAWRAALESVRDRAEVKAVVQRANGPAFSAGGDIRQILEVVEQGDAMRRQRLLEAYHGLLRAMMEIPQVVITAVHGAVYGAAGNLVLASDVLIAADDTRFSQAFVRVGLVPDSGGFYFLPRQVGSLRAKELMFSGREVNAREALELGLVTEVVPAGELLARARAWAGQVAMGPSLVLSAIKRQVNASPLLGLQESLQLEGAAQALAVSTQDAREGLRAFVERRPPRFTGR